MERATEKFTRLRAPHPLVILGGLAVLAALALVHYELGFLSPTTFVIVLVACAALFSRVSRRSARRMYERHLRELDEMRGKPVLHLNDHD